MGERRRKRRTMKTMTQKRKKPPNRRPDAGLRAQHHQEVTPTSMLRPATEEDQTTNQTNLSGSRKEEKRPLPSPRRSLAPRTSPAGRSGVERKRLRRRGRRSARRAATTTQTTRSP